MAARISALPPDIVVTPGDESAIQLTVRNVGELVDRFTFEVVGAAAGWTEMVPAQLPLLPGAEGTVELRFKPPRAPATSAGTHAITVRALSEKDPAEPATREGTIQVTAFFGMTARVVPQNSRGRRKAEHQLTVRNEGNDAMTARMTATDADGALRFDVAPASLDVPAGRAATGTLRLRADKLMLKGKPRACPFQVAVSSGDTTIPLDGTFMQKPLIPRWLIIAVVGLIGLFAFMSKQNDWGGLAVVLLVILLVALLIAVVLLLLVATLAKNLFRRRRAPEIPPAR